MGEAILFPTASWGPQVTLTFHVMTWFSCFILLEWKSEKFNQSRLKIMNFNLLRFFGFSTTKQTLWVLLINADEHCWGSLTYKKTSFQMYQKFWIWQPLYVEVPPYLYVIYICILAVLGRELHSSYKSLYIKCVSKNGVKIVSWLVWINKSPYRNNSPKN